ncbi:MAG: type II toxin-antitoxin system prevent-host-death family antitoxin [Schumannella sp.]
MTTMTSRELNHDVSAAKRAAESGPVEITDHGRRSHVLLTADDYDRLSRQSEPVGSRLFAPTDLDLEWPERSRESSLRVPAL